MKNEEWRDIKGYEGKYQISNLGRVRSIRIRAYTEKDNGYRYVTLNKNGANHNFFIHRLVAEAFLGEIPSGYVVNHIDYDRANNCLDNLEIITQKENVWHSIHRMRKPRKEKNPDRYIRYRKGSYEVTVNREYLGRYKTIEEARKVRDEYIEKINYHR